MSKYCQGCACETYETVEDTHDVCDYCEAEIDVGERCKNCYYKLEQDYDGVCEGHDGYCDNCLYDEEESVFYSEFRKCNDDAAEELMILRLSLRQESAEDNHDPIQSPPKN